MTYDDIEGRLLSEPGAVKEMPFGPSAVVFKVGGKMFALVGWDEEPLRLALKCDPEEAEYLRAAFAAVTPAYHMNKRHWNDVLLDGSMPPDRLDAMIRHSYELVVKGLKKTDREALGM